MDVKSMKCDELRNKIEQQDSRMESLINIIMKQGNSKSNERVKVLRMLVTAFCLSYDALEEIQDAFEKHKEKEDIKERAVVNDLVAEKWKKELNIAYEKKGPYITQIDIAASDYKPNGDNGITKYLVNFGERKAKDYFKEEIDNIHNTTMYYDSMMEFTAQVKRDDDTIGQRFECLKRAWEEVVEEYIKESKLEDCKKSLETVLKAHFETISECIEEGEKAMGKGKTYNEIKNDIEGMIEEGVTQIILTGAPGTGKTKMAKEIAGNQYKFVQFHPSYDYTDFVEGLRPVEIDNDVTFKKVDGVFKHFCREVVKKNKEAGGNKKYYFIIDEINRADLSKVFGELMYCLETDKRGEGNRIDTQYQNLPTYNIEERKDISKEEDDFFDGFYIPENVIVIGTMNDIDRSVESMDFALRRRFAWYEVAVNKPFLQEAFTAMIKDLKLEDSDATVSKQLAGQVTKLNKKIKDEGAVYGLNEQYFISQGQFANLPKQKWEKLLSESAKLKEAPNDKAINEFLAYVWERRIKLLLREYVRGEDDVERFLGACETALMFDNDSNADISDKASETEAVDETDSGEI